MDIQPQQQIANSIKKDYYKCSDTQKQSYNDALKCTIQHQWTYDTVLNDIPNIAERYIPHRT
eukprot:9870868-Karenia_brevis.AAC.1